MPMEREMLHKEIERIVKNGAKVNLPNEEEFQVKLNNLDIEEELIQWFNTHKVRVPNDILDFFDFLDRFIKKNKIQLKTQEKRYNKKITGSYEDCKYFVEKRKQFINRLLKEEEDRLECEWLPQQLDTLTLTEIIYARRSVINYFKKAQKALNDIISTHRRINRNMMKEIYELTKELVFSALLIDLRILEIITFNQLKLSIEASLNLVEWDLNTIELSTYRLTEYNFSLSEKTISKNDTQAKMKKVR